MKLIQGDCLYGARGGRKKGQKNKVVSNWIYKGGHNAKIQKSRW